MNRKPAVHLLICLTLVVISFMLPSPASACSCAMPGSPSESFRESGAVFSGKVIDISGASSPATALLYRIFSRLNFYPAFFYSDAFWGNEVTFSVQQSWKGVSETEVTVYTGSGGGDCGYSFAPGNDYLVYAYQIDRTSGSGLGTGICSRTTQLSYATDDMTYLNTLPTLPLTPVSNNTWLYVACCSLTLFTTFGVGVVLWSRRRRRQSAA